MATLTMKYDNRPDGDLIELTNVGVFSNGETTELEPWQVDNLELHYGLVGDELTIPALVDVGDGILLPATPVEPVVQPEQGAADTNAFVQFVDDREGRNN